MTRQKNRSNDQQVRASIQAAEAVALGTMAGGLALAAAQAREAQPLAEDDARSVQVAQADQPLEQTGQAQPVTADEAAEAETASGAEAVGATPSLPVAPDGKSSPETEVRPDEALPATAPIPEGELQAVAVDGPSAEQISGVVEQLVNDIAGDSAAEGSALPLAGQILESVAQIVSTLKPGLDVSALTSLGSALQAQVQTTLEPTKSLLQDLPETIGNTVDTALDAAGLGPAGAGLAELSSTISQSVTEALGGGTLGGLTSALDLGGLPSSLLGNDGPASDTGLLSNLFYSDGEAELAGPPSLIGQSLESLQIPELTQMASGTVTDIADVGLGLLALSYADLSPDGFHPASGGIGGLGLL